MDTTNLRNMRMDFISSESVTEDIRIRAIPAYQADHSSPDQNRFLFSYHIIIRNESKVPVTLKSRCWKIINAEGDEHEPLFKIQHHHQKAL